MILQITYHELIFTSLSLIIVCSVFHTCLFSTKKKVNYNIFDIKTVGNKTENHIRCVHYMIVISEMMNLLTKSIQCYLYIYMYNKYCYLCKYTVQ